MLEKIIEFSIRQRWLVMAIVLGLAGLGIWNFNRLPIDAVPDITNVQVQVNTEAPGFSPLEAEQRITFPVETAISGLPGLSYTRSVSRYGLSQVTASWSVNGSSPLRLICRRASPLSPAPSQRVWVKFTCTSCRLSRAP